MVRFCFWYFYSVLIFVNISVVGHWIPINDQDCLHNVKILYRYICLVSLLLLLLMLRDIFIWNKFFTLMNYSFHRNSVYAWRKLKQIKNMTNRWYISLECEFFMLFISHMYIIPLLGFFVWLASIIKLIFFNAFYTIKWEMITISLLINRIASKIIFLNSMSFQQP